MTPPSDIFTDDQLLAILNRYLWVLDDLNQDVPLNLVRDSAWLNRDLNARIAFWISDVLIREPY